MLQHYLELLPGAMQEQQLADDSPGPQLQSITPHSGYHLHQSSSTPMFGIRREEVSLRSLNFSRGPEQPGPDGEGQQRALTRDEIFIVAPYNDQVNRPMQRLPGAKVTSSRASRRPWSARNAPI
jgi:hypothetical protein